MPLPRLQSIRRLAAFGLAAPCGCQPAQPIKVAFICGLSGRVSELAIDGRNGAQLAIETLNAQAGPRYELRIHDDGRAPEGAAATIDAVADEGDAFAIGPMTSVVAQRMVPEATRRQFVLISPTANSDEPSGADDWFFRVIPPAGPGAEQIADAAILRGLRTASVMAEWRNRTYKPAYVEFRKRFIERFGNPPSQAAVFSYDATMMGAEGLRRKTDRQSLRDMLRAPGEWPGLQEPVVLDHFGDSIRRFHLSEVRKGRFVMLGS
jgi:ABC-type branched-subunit amino acid transport system substrate-binding protein